MAEPKENQKIAFNLVLGNHDQKEASFKFDVSFSEDEMDVLGDFFHGEADRGEEEAEEAEKEVEETKSDVDALWDVITKRRPEDEYDDEFIYGEEEEAEEEEEISTEVPTPEKLEEEELVAEEPTVPEIPAEIMAEREALISKLTELLNEKAELKRKNKILELWVFRNIKRTQQRMIPADPTKTIEQMEELYKEVLKNYKVQVDDIQTQQAELTYELNNYFEKTQSLQAEDDMSFGQFLEREREVGTGLIFAKTGKKVSDKLMNNLLQRQIARRKILTRDRHKYIMLQHRFEDLNIRLKEAETLGEGMTTMDYEALHIANVGYRDRVDERDRELEKLRIKIAETVNGVAQYKEKEVCIVEDIKLEQAKLEEYSEENTKIRECLNKAHVTLNELRDVMNEKKQEAGLLVAQQELIEMEKIMRSRDELKEKIIELEHKIKLFGPAKQKMKERYESQISFFN